MHRLVMDLELEARVDAKKGTATIGKGEMIAWEIGAKMALANPVHNDSKTDHPFKNHTGVGISYTPERHVIAGAVHVRMDTRTEGWIRQRNGDPTMLP